MTPKNLVLDPRLYRGNAETAAHHFAKKWPRDLLLWALDIEAGEYFASCGGCNRKVVSKELVWVDAWQFDHDGKHPEDKTTEILHEVILTDNRGYWHYCPGGGCALPKETPEEVTAYWREWAFDDKYPERTQKWHGQNTEGIEKALAKWENMQEAFRNKRPIVDEFGELLPEFDEKSDAKKSD